jgi:maltose O-acetyltransferase
MVIINTFKNWLLALHNHCITYLPFSWLRKAIQSIGYRVSVGIKSKIERGLLFYSPQKIVIGNNTIINRNCTLEARGGIKIGDNVSISEHCSFFTSSHDPQSPDFTWVKKEIKIEDYVWIGAHALILQGITIGKGAVVGAGSIVTKDVEPYTIVAGNPAKPIGSRTKNLTYKLNQ